jgi:hypothetical protein
MSRFQLSGHLVKRLAGGRRHQLCRPKTETDQKPSRRATLNPDATPLSTPNLVVKPTLAQILAGNDPVLTAALAYHPAGPGHS